ncbi:ChaN family lipoprotein [Chelatococcus asaccharovorans]|uniref:ChaN family lipoprotein n=1 Tax=Chelatococcus asaccharovorans TaxID=28210 RepID=UPI00224C7B48|nr:ChaN family lipoprotein [Chelatococcus asaccharovorans]CAH1651035.1 putative iron-regulated protein [Chelatococcus asaccharovorans]CAH1686679.1 putative iron-regulated protein [Chelatococcus asaccharovorans]
MTNSEVHVVPHPRGTWLDPASGQLTDQRQLLQKAAFRRAVLLGETHDVAEIHRWQLHVLAFLHMLNAGLAVGFEMFPRRLQPVLDAWVDGEMDTETFQVRSEWYDVWGFDPALYLPIFHFCRQQKVPMLALNCHRPLVTRVGKEGWEAIPEDERDGLTPSAPATAAYRQYLFNLVGGGRAGGPSGMAQSADDPAFDRFVRAQQTWDRAFACNIARALAERPIALVVGIIGRGHLEYGHGTPYQLRDLGISDVSVLLPSEADTQDLGAVAGIADAIFRLDRPEPPNSWRAKRPTPATAPAEGSRS